MNSEKIRFNCPSCGIQLDVPASLAGVTGPCPSCQATITAPHPQAPEPVVAPPATPPPAAVPAPVSTPDPIPEQPVYQPEAVPAPLPPQETPSQVEPLPPVHEAPLQPEPQVAPQQEYTQQPESTAGQNVFPTVVPNPAQPEVHPTPSEPPFPIDPSPVNEIPTQRDPDGPSLEMMEQAPSSSGQPPSPTKQGSRIPSLLFLLAAMIAMAIAVLAVLNYTGVVGLNSLKSLFGMEKSSEQQVISPPPAQRKNSLPPPVEQSSPSQISAPEARDTPVEQAPNPSDDIPVPQLPEGENYREGETPLPEALSIDTNDHRQVQKILASFISAKDLAQRGPFLSTESMSNPKIKSSPLAGEIPEPTSTLFLDMLTDDQEQRTDFFYVVSWDGENNTPSKPMTVELHKWPGSEPPRVHSEAFLEFYQQKLARYAAAPLDRPAQFFVIAECVPKCFESDVVPNHLDKATLKLGAFPNDRSPVKAYFNKKGEILEELKAFRDGLSFRKGIPLTVTLAWSQPGEEGNRFLEVIKIDSFDWHP